MKSIKYKIQYLVRFFTLAVVFGFFNCIQAYGVTPATVSLQNTYITVSEGNSASVVINRTGDISKSTTVYYRTLNGSGLSGVHFINNQGSITFASGEASKTINIATTVCSTWEIDNRFFYFEIYKVGVEDNAVINKSGSITQIIINHKDVITTNGVNTWYIKYKDPNNHHFEDDGSVTTPIQNITDYAYWKSIGCSIKAKFGVTIGTWGSDVRLSIKASNNSDGSNSTGNTSTFEDQDGWYESGELNVTNYNYIYGIGEVFNAEAPLTGDDGDINQGEVKVYVTDTTNPTIQSYYVVGNTSEPYSDGDDLYISVKFNEIVNVSGGIPQLPIKFSDNSIITADYIGGSGTDVLVFKLTIPNGKSTSGLYFRSDNSFYGEAYISDLAGNTMQDILNAELINSGIKIQSTTPIIKNITTDKNNISLNPGKTVDFTLQFSEPIIITGTPILNLNNGATATLTSATGTKLVYARFRYTIGNNHSEDTASLSISSIEGGTIVDYSSNTLNRNITNGTTNIRVDTTPSVITLSTNSGNIYAKSYSPKITATDTNGSGIKEVKYLWSSSSSRPSDASFILGANNIDAFINAETGGRYLHVKVEDIAGNVTYHDSGEFKLDNTEPTINLSANGGSVSKVHRTTITVSDLHSGSTGHFKYIWSTSSTTPIDTQFDSANAGAEGIELVKSIGNGPYYLHIRTEDNAGNRSYKTSNEFIFDNIAPTDNDITVSNINPSNETVASDNYERSYTISITAQDSNEAYADGVISSIKYQWKDGTAQIAMGDAGWIGFTGPFEYNNNLITGEKYLHLLVVDEAGNEGYKTYKYTFDYDEPNIVFNSSNLTGVYNKVTSEINVTDNLNSLNTFKYVWLPYAENNYDSVDWINGSITGDTANGSATKNDVSGNFYLHAYAEDNAGNGIYKVSGPYTIDLEGPTGSLNIDEAAVGEEGTVTLKLSAIDNTPTNSLYYALSQDGGNAWGEWIQFPNEVTVSNYGIINLEEGIKTITAKFKDVLGNESEIYSDTVTIDLTPPTAELSYNPVKEAGWTKEDVVAGLINVSDNLTEKINIKTPNGLQHTFADNGSYEFILEDEVGNRTIIGVTVDWIDKTAPNITSIAGNQIPSKEHAASINVTDNTTSNESINVSYQWTKDSAPLSYEDTNWIQVDNGSEVNKNGVEGEWYLQVKAEDAAGNYNISISGKFIFDNTPPSGSISIAESYIKNNTVTLNLASQDTYSNFSDIQYSLSKDGENWSQWQSLNSSNITINNYSIIDEEGVRKVYVKYKDKLDNESEIYTATVILDKQGPTCELVYSSNSEEGYTKENVTVELVNISDNYTSTEDIILSETTYEFIANSTHTFTLEDKAGNVTTISAAVNWIDKTNPEISISPNSNLTPAKEQVVNINVTDNVTSEENLLISYQWTQGETFPSIDDENWTSTNNNEQIIVSEGDGEWYLHLKAYDQVGNFKTFSSGKYVLDNTKPVGSIDIKEDMTKFNSITLYLSSADEVTDSGSIKYSLSLDGSTWSDWSYLSQIVNNYSVPNIEGTTTVYVKYKDELNNESDIYSDSVILDLTPPSAEVVYSHLKNDGYVNTDVTATLVNIQDNYTESENIEENQISYNFTTNGEFIFTITDLVGNTSTIKAKVDWIDKEAPIIQAISGNQNPKKQYSVLINAIDNITTESEIKLYYQWTTNNTIPEVDDLGWISVVNNSVVTKSDADGERYIHVKAEDSLRNISFISSGKFVLDNTPPEGIVSYSTLNRTAQPVIASITASETVNITNPIDGSNKYTFDDNGIFTFEFEDLAGNKNSVTAEVNWIDKTIPTANVTLSTTEWTKDNIEVVVSVPVDSRIEIGEFQFDGIDDYALINEQIETRELEVNEMTNQYIYKTAYSIGDNGKIIFQIKDVDTEITHDIEVTIDRIDKTKPTYEISYSEVNPTKNHVAVGIIAQDNSNLPVEIIKPEEANFVDGNYVFSENGNYEFLIKDKAGNTESILVSISNIDKIAPALNIVYSETDWTNNNVIATVFANEPIEVLNNNGSAEYEFSSNGEYEFEVKDSAGNISRITAQVNNIDKTNPEAEIKYNPINIVNTDVVIEIIPSEEVTIISLENLKLVEGSTNKFIAEVNGTYEFKLIDRAGNEITKKIVISNIDKASPVIDYTLSTTEPTNKEVEIYLNSNEIFQVISLPEGIREEVIEGNSRYYVSEKGSYNFKVKDSAGNEGEVIVEVTNIDKAAPTLTLNYSTEELTNKDVTVTVSADEEITVLNNEGKFTRIFTGNGEFKFGVQDRAGNKSEIVAQVTNIDKEKPVASISYSPTGIVNTDVVITLEANEIVDIESLEGLELEEGTSNKYIAKTNGKYSFRLVDRAGNENIQAITIITIDKESPQINYSLSTEELTNTDVQIYLYSNEAYEVMHVQEGIREEVVDGNSRYYARENGSYIFKVKDMVGNEGEVVVGVTNIDKAPPILSIKYSTTEPTNEPVISTLSSNEDIAVLNNNGQITFEFLQNGEFTFNAKDLAGNEAIVTAKVSNIDKMPPAASTAYSTTDMTNEDVVVTITGNELLQSIISQEGLEMITEGEEESFFTRQFKVVENGAYRFDITDLAGNSKIYTVNITNIDKASPVLNYTLVYDTPAGIKEINQDGEYIRFPDITTGDNKEIYEKSLITKNPIVINFNVNEDYEMIAVPENISLNNEGKFQIGDNGTYNFKAKDTAGNITEVSIVIDTIDNTKPEVKVAYSTLNKTKEDVIATVESVNGEDIRVVNNYNRASKVFTNNGEYTFIVQDYAGNQVELIASVNNIDRTPPELSVDYSTVETTNESVTIEVRANEEFKIVNNEGSKFYTFEDNGSIRLVAEDLIGNKSEIVVTVDNIDKVAPNIIFTGNENMVILQDEDFDLLEDVTTAIYADKDLPISVNGRVNNKIPGKYTISYSVTDKAGNTATRERKIQVLPKGQLLVTFDGVNANEVSYLIGSKFSLETFNAQGKYTILYCKGKEQIGYMKIKGIEITSNEFSVEESGWYSFLIMDQERNTQFYSIFIVK